MITDKVFPAIHGAFILVDQAAALVEVAFGDLSVEVCRQKKHGRKTKEHSAQQSEEHLWQD